ncbi:hypothetical protein STEG23_019440 [Scotinomys teguina]
MSGLSSGCGPAGPHRHGSQFEFLATRQDAGNEDRIQESGAGLLTAAIRFSPALHPLPPPLVNPHSGVCLLSPTC